MTKIAPGRVAAATGMLLLAGCSADLTLPGSPPPGLAVAVVQGDGQTGTVGDTLAQPVVVVVKTDAGQPIPGRRVAFVPTQAGEFDPDTAVTDAVGQAQARWVLGTTAGVYRAEARLVAGGDSVLPPAALQATAGPGSPDTLRSEGPAIQSGHRGQPLDRPLVVAAVDRFGNAVAGVEVRWEAGPGNGQLSVPSSVTAADGTASVVWTLGNRVGVEQATATVPGLQGSPVLFSATVLF